MTYAPASVAVFASAVWRDGDPCAAFFVSTVELLYASRPIAGSRVPVVRITIQEVWPVGRIETSDLGTDGTGAMRAG
jgi:hypothetical protein